MPNMASLMYKLQLALKQKDYIITIGTTQFYSEDQDRFIKLYKLRHNRKEIVQTASQIIIIRCMKQILDMIKTLEDTRVPRDKWDSEISEMLSKETYKEPTNINTERR